MRNELLGLQALESAQEDAKDLGLSQFFSETPERENKKRSDKTTPTSSSNGTNAQTEQIVQSNNETMVSNEQTTTRAGRTIQKPAHFKVYGLE